jgi:ParB/RepB/Spo0J family partition protein
MTETTDTKNKAGVLRSMALKRTDIFHVNPRELQIVPNMNLRFSYGECQDDLDLVESIKNEGVKVAVKVFQRDGKVFVSDGHRRHWATMRAIEQGAEIKTIPCVLAERGYNEREATFEMFVLNTGKQLDPLEQAEGIKRLLAWGYTPKDIALRIQKTEAHISNCKALLQIPPKVQKLIRDNKIASTLVLDLARKHSGSPEKLEEKVEAAVKLAEATGRKRATKKHAAVDPEEQTVRVGKLALIGILEGCIKGLKSESEKTREAALTAAQEFLARYSDEK